MMKLRKFMAGTLAATMVVGSSMMAFAAETQTGEATGIGTSVGHVDKEVLTVTLPTGTDAVFNYWVDPERVIDAAGALKNGTTVTKNDDGVYFKTGENTYASTSAEVVFTGQNSVAVDVSVAASVTSAGDNDIALVADETALSAATTPALLMNLTVGTDIKAITSDGATTAKATLDGVPDNFEIKTNGSEYQYAPKGNLDADTWKKTTVKLSGKTNKKDIASDMTAPTIKLTWTINKHEPYLSSTTMSASSNSVTLSLPDGVSIDKAEITRADGTGAIALAANQYPVNDGTLTVSSEDIATWVGLSPAYNKLVVTFSDGTSETITLQ